MSPESDAGVTILGGGAVGICTALELVERGIPVRLIDRDAPGQGASSGNAGVISPFSVVPQSMPGVWKKAPGWLLDPLGPVAVRARHLPRFLPWALRFVLNGSEARARAVSAAMDGLTAGCVDLYRRHLEGTGHEGLVRDSCYVLAHRDPALASDRGLDAELRRMAGARVEVIGADALREMEPDLSPEFRAAVVVHGQARALSPGRLMAVLAEKLRALGGEVLQREVRALRPCAEGGWQIECEGETVHAARVVVSAGAWSARLLAPLGLRLPLEAERGYHVMFADPGVTLRNSVMDTDRKFVSSSMEGGLRAAGTAEFGGLDALPDPRRAETIAGLARQMVPGLGSAAVTTWSGVRPSFPDSLPVIGEMPGHPGLYGAFGHSHYGFMMAPRTGRIMADLLRGAGPNIDLSPYRADRFGSV
ncbi:oxidoreductase, FAD-binding protein [Roseobacter sp. AzwK-3b]|uniref:NAD(P)/FAD-dependent oxidoreductase n=1 Tax=Roseobacter sp. AzwK-3b TaxID=351016 RepID=UPI0001568C52|nr:FAD-binding oxidoreductase [Roseobacter sp. AzwK-3b]EDM70717.1 oxidoreductase, FAD-binding protein [Roseobacter sp. AzwK-3b]